MRDTEFTIVLVLLHHHVSQCLIFSIHCLYYKGWWCVCVNAWMCILSISFELTDLHDICYEDRGCGVHHDYDLLALIHPGF